MRGAIAPIAVLGAAIALYVAGERVLFSNGSGYVLRAELRDASGLANKSAVKVGGVPAGDVTGIELTKRDTALVTMRLDAGAAPIAEGTTARVRPVNLLGEKYVELVQGGGRPVPSGAVIPLQRTSHAVELDDVLNTLDTDTRTRLAILLNESGVAMRGRGTDLNAVLRQLPPALDDARRLVGGLAQDDQHLRDLIDQGDRVITAMNGRRDDLQRLVGNAEATLTSTARKRARIGEIVRGAPPALTQLRATLGELEGSARALAPASAALRGAAPPLARTLGDLPAFTHDALPALRAVAADAPWLARLGAGAQPTIAHLRPTAGDLSTFATELAPVVRALDKGDVMRDALKVMWGWARTIQGSDGLGHIFGLRLTVDNTLITSALQRLLPGVSRRGSHRAGRPPQARPERPSIALPQIKLPRVAVPPLPAPVTKALDTVGKTVKEVTRPVAGATGKDVDRALRFLLGP